VCPTENGGILLRANWSEKYQNSTQLRQLFVQNYLGHCVGRTSF